MSIRISQPKPRYGVLAKILPPWRYSVLHTPYLPGGAGLLFLRKPESGRRFALYDTKALARTMLLHQGAPSPGIAWRRRRDQHPWTEISVSSANNIRPPTPILPSSRHSPQRSTTPLFQRHFASSMQVDTRFGRRAEPTESPVV